MSATTYWGPSHRCRYPTSYYIARDSMLDEADKALREAGVGGAEGLAAQFILRAMAGDLFAGQPVGGSLNYFAGLVVCSLRTVRRALDTLVQIGVLTRRYVERGSTAYNGRRSANGHNQWSLGERLRALLPAPAKTPEKTKRQGGVASLARGGGQPGHRSLRDPVTGSPPPKGGTPPVRKTSAEAGPPRTGPPGSREKSPEPSRSSRAERLAVLVAIPERQMTTAQRVEFHRLAQRQALDEPLPPDQRKRKRQLDAQLRAGTLKAEKKPRGVITAVLEAVGFRSPTVTRAQPRGNEPRGQWTASTLDAAISERRGHG